MDADAVALHAAEPGHLALGELVDGVPEEDVHLLVGQLPQKILRNEFILKTVPEQVFGRDTAVQEALDLFDETVFQALVQPAVDAGDALLAGDEGADVKGLLRKPFRRNAVLLVELVGAGDRLDIQARPAAQDGDSSP